MGLGSHARSDCAATVHETGVVQAVCRLPSRSRVAIASSNVEGASSLLQGKTGGHACAKRLRTGVEDAWMEVGGCQIVAQQGHTHTFA